MPSTEELQKAMKKRLAKQRAEHDKVIKGGKALVETMEAQAQILQKAQAILTRPKAGSYDKTLDKELQELKERMEREEALREKAVISESLAKLEAGGSVEIVGAPIKDELADPLGSTSAVVEVVGGGGEAKLEPSVGSKDDGHVSEDGGLSRPRSDSSTSVANDGVLEVDDNVSKYGSARGSISSGGSEDDWYDLESDEENAEEYYSADYLTKKFEPSIFEPSIELLRKSGKNKGAAEELIDEINKFVENRDVESLELLKEKLEEAQKGAKSPLLGTSHFKTGIEEALSAIGQIQNEEGVGDYANLDASTGSDAGRESVVDEELGTDQICFTAEDPRLQGKSTNAASRESDSSRATGEDDPIMSFYHQFADQKKQLLQKAIPDLNDEDIHKIHNDPKRVEAASKNKDILDHSKYDDILSHKIIAEKFTHPKYENGFRPVGWDQSHAIESREVTERKSKIFGNDDLVEKTKMTKVNGRDMKARTCNFPSGITDGTGPLHLSIILKDENGKNMEKSKAVYFTAHYDSNGKLKEMTYPIPIQFDEKSGQGFFIRDNKTYTLPIDRNTFERMRAQMDINRSNTRDTSEKELGDDSIRQAGSKDAANQLRSRLDSSFSAKEVGGGKLVDSSLTVDGSDKGLSHSKLSSSKDRLVLHDAEESSSRERSGSLSKALKLSSIESSEREYVVPSNSGSAIDAGGLALKAPESSSIGNSKPEHPAISSSSGANSVELVVSKAPESSSGAASSSLAVVSGDDQVRIVAHSVRSNLSHTSSSSASFLPKVQPKAPDSFQVPEAQDKKKVKIGDKEFDCYTYNKSVNVYIDEGHVYEVPSTVAQKTGFKAIHSDANNAYQEFLKPKKKDGASI